MNKRCCEPVERVDSGWRKDYNPCQHKNTLYIAIDTKELLFNGVVYNKFNISDICFKNGTLYINVGNKLLSCKIPNATTECPGLMSPLDKQQLDYIFQLLLNGIDSINISNNTSWGVGLIVNEDRLIQPEVTPVTTFEELINLQEDDEKLISAYLLKRLIECNNLNYCQEEIPTEFTVTFILVKDGETSIIDLQRIPKNGTYVHNYSLPRGYALTISEEALYLNGIVKISNVSRDIEFTVTVTPIQYPITINNDSGAFTITNNPPTTYTVNSEDIVIQYTFNNIDYQNPLISFSDNVRLEGNYLVIPSGSIGNVNITFDAEAIYLRVLVEPISQVTEIVDGSSGEIKFRTNVPATISLEPTGVSLVWSATSSSSGTLHTITVRNLTNSNSEYIIQSGTFKVVARATGYLDSNKTSVQPQNIRLLAADSFSISTNYETLEYGLKATITAHTIGTLNENNTTWRLSGSYAELSSEGPAREVEITNINTNVTKSIHIEPKGDSQLSGNSIVEYTVTKSIVSKNQPVVITGYNNTKSDSKEIILKPQPVTVLSYKWTTGNGDIIDLNGSESEIVKVSLRNSDIQTVGQVVLACKVTFSDGTSSTDNITIPYRGEYTITFNANGGNSTPASITKGIGESFVLPSAITRNSSTANTYTFGGWNTNSDGTGTNYSAGQTCSNISTNTILYAKWIPTARKYNVTINVVNGSFDGRETQSISYGSKATWTVHPDSGYSLPTNVTNGTISNGEVTSDIVRGNLNVTVTCVEVEETYYWYVGQTNPSTMTEISPIVTDNTSPGWRLIGTELPNYSSSNKLYDGTNPDLNIITGSSLAIQWVAIPNNSSACVRDGAGNDGSTVDICTRKQNITLNGIEYKVYEWNGKTRRLGYDIY